MIVFIIATVLIGTGLSLFFMKRFDYNPLVVLAVLLVFGVVFAASLAGIKHNLVGDAEKYEFSVNGSHYEMFYDHESEQYFILATTSKYNPINWLGKEYLETKDVEKFLEVYEKYNKSAEELEAINLFG